MGQGHILWLVHYLEEEWPARGVHLGKSFLGLDRVLGGVGFFGYDAFDLLALFLGGCHIVCFQCI